MFEWGYLPHTGQRSPFKQGSVEPSGRDNGYLQPAETREYNNVEYNEYLLARFAATERVDVILFLYLPLCRSFPDIGSIYVFSQ